MTVGMYLIVSTSVSSSFFSFEWLMVCGIQFCEVLMDWVFFIIIVCLISVDMRYTYRAMFYHGYDIIGVMLWIVYNCYSVTVQSGLMMWWKAMHHKNKHDRNTMKWIHAVYVWVCVRCGCAHVMYMKSDFEWVIECWWWHSKRKSWNEGIGKKEKKEKWFEGKERLFFLLLRE